MVVGCGGAMVNVERISFAPSGFEHVERAQQIAKSYVVDSPSSLVKTHSGNAHTHTQYLRLLTPMRSTKFGGNPIILNT